MRTLTVLILSVLLITGVFGVQAQLESACPAGIPDRPALSQHIEQADILNGTLDFDGIFAHGKELFTVRFNICDGQGRPAATGTGKPRDPDEPTFNRVSAPDSTSCEGCHNQPRDGGAGDFVANVFVVGTSCRPGTGLDFR